MAGENVVAGDFVELVTDCGVSGRVQLCADAGTGNFARAILLGNGNILVVYSLSTAGLILASIMSVEDGTASTLSTAFLGTTRRLDGGFKAVPLPSGDVFIAYRRYSTHLLYGILIGIDGSAVTVKSDAVIGSVATATLTVDALLLDEERVLVTFSDKLTSFYGMIVTISGGAFTAGAAQAIGGIAAGGKAAPVLLPDGGVFIAYPYGDSTCIYGMTAAVSDGVITTGETTALCETEMSGRAINCTLLPGGRVFIAHSAGDDYRLRGLTASVTGGLLSAGGDAVLNDCAYSAYDLRVAALPDGGVFLCHGMDSGKNLLRCMTANVCGSAVTAGSGVQLGDGVFNAACMDAVLLPGGDVFVAHGGGSGPYLWGGVVSVQSFAQKSLNAISGVAGSGGGGGAKIDVYVPA